MKVGRYARNRVKQWLHEGRRCTPAFVLATLKYVMDQRGIPGAGDLAKNAHDKFLLWDEVLWAGCELYVKMALTPASALIDEAHDNVDMRADLLEIYEMLRTTQEHMSYQRYKDAAWWMDRACHRIQYVFKKYKLGRLYPKGIQKEAK